MKLLDLIELCLHKVNSLFYKEYCLKLDDYYYDSKKNSYIVILRFRNKKAIVKSSILDIIKNQNLIDSLHPYDSYTIGTIKTMQENKYVINSAVINRDYEDYYIIDPFIDWVGTDFTENKLIFKPKYSFTEMRISIESFCRDLKMMRAIGSANCFLIGSMAASFFIQSSACL